MAIAQLHCLVDLYTPSKFSNSLNSDFPCQWEPRISVTLIVDCINHI